MPTPRPPRSYTTHAKARFNETWQLDGHLRTADQVLAFSNEIVSTTPALTVRWYQFEFDSVLYEFNLAGEQAKGINTNDDLNVLINPSDLSKCWLNGHELVVHPWQPSEDL